MTSTTDADGPERYLRLDALGRVRTPSEEREAILDKFEKSGASAAMAARLALQQVEPPPPERAPAIEISR